MKRKKDVSLGKLDVNVKNRTAVLVASASLNLSKNFLKEKRSYFKNQMW